MMHMIITTFLLSNVATVLSLHMYHCQITICNIFHKILCALFCLGFQKQGAVSIRKTVLPGMAIPMLKIRRPNGRLIFNMEIAIRI